MVASPGSYRTVPRTVRSLVLFPGFSRKAGPRPVRARSPVSRRETPRQSPICQVESVSGFRHHRSSLLGKPIHCPPLSSHEADPCEAEGRDQGQGHSWLPGNCKGKGSARKVSDHPPRRFPGGVGKYGIVRKPGGHIPCLFPSLGKGTSSPVGKGVAKHRLRSRHRPTARPLQFPDRDGPAQTKAASFRQQETQVPLPLCPPQNSTIQAGAVRAILHGKDYLVSPDPAGQTSVLKGNDLLVQ